MIAQPVVTYSKKKRYYINSNSIRTKIVSCYGQTTLPAYNVSEFSEFLSYLIFLVRQRCNKWWSNSKIIRTTHTHTHTHTHSASASALHIPVTSVSLNYSGKDTIVCSAPLSNSLSLSVSVLKRQNFFSYLTSKVFFL